MKRILLPIDYSETAYNAFKYALQLADKQDAELYVLHVYDPPVISGRITPELVQSVYDKHQFDELQRIKEQTPVLEKIQEEMGKTNVEVFLKIKPGLLIPQIQDFIKEHDIEYIVMGTDGISGFEKKLLGSNTINTIIKVNVPVLSVPKEAHFKKPETILFLTNFSKGEEESLDLLAKEAKDNNMKVRCLHLKNPSSDYEEIHDKWKERYKDDPLTFHVFESGKSVYKMINHYIEVESIDLVAMVHERQDFFKRLFSSSFTIHLGKRLGTPLLAYQMS